MKVLVVAAEAGRQWLVPVEAPKGATVRQALALAVSAEPALLGRLQAETPVGVWGRLVPRDHALREGDRVELLRAIRADAKAMRRERAGASLTAPLRRRSVP